MRLIRWIANEIAEFLSAYESLLAWYHDELIKAVDSKDYARASFLWDEIQRALGIYNL